jgi:hypothetical protein
VEVTVSPVADAKFLKPAVVTFQAAFALLYEPEDPSAVADEVVET